MITENLLKIQTLLLEMLEEETKPEWLEEFLEKASCDFDSTLIKYLNEKDSEV